MVLLTFFMVPPSSVLQDLYLRTEPVRLLLQHKGFGMVLWQKTGCLRVVLASMASSPASFCRAFLFSLEVVSCMQK